MFSAAEILGEFADAQWLGRRPHVAQVLAYEAPIAARAWAAKVREKKRRAKARATERRRWQTPLPSAVAQRRAEWRELKRRVRGLVSVARARALWVGIPSRVSLAVPFVVNRAVCPDCGCMVERRQGTDRVIHFGNVRCGGRTLQAGAA